MIKRKTLRKIVYFLVFLTAGLAAFVWIYPNFFIKLDTAEVDGYYDLLSAHAKPSKQLMLDLGVKQDDDIQLAIDRIKSAMGLDGYRIWIGYSDDEKPPAYIKNVAPGAMIIMLSKHVTERREQINLLIHELGHIYVWTMDKAILKGCDEEKVVDCAGVYLGLGILMLNGLTDDTFFIPGTEYASEKKAFGYVRPELLGYLLARYCRDHNIAEDKIIPRLYPAGLKYFNIGRNYLARK